MGWADAYQVNGTLVSFENVAVDDTLLSREDLKHLMFSVERFAIAADWVLRTIPDRLKTMHADSDAEDPRNCRAAFSGWFKTAL